MDRKKSFFNILSLCLRGLCPVCSCGLLFTPLAKVSSMAQLCIPAERCNYCHFEFCREPGYYFGVLTPLLPILSLMTGLAFVAISYFVWPPEEPTELLLPGLIGTVIGMILFFRPTIAFYISVDHAINPPVTLSHLG